MKVRDERIYLLINDGESDEIMVFMIVVVIYVVILMMVVDLERFGMANTEYWYIGIKISVNTGISPAFGVFLRKQIELRNADKNKF